MPKSNPQTLQTPDQAHPGLPPLDFDEESLPVEQVVNGADKGAAPRNDEVTQLRTQIDTLSGKLTALQEQNLTLMAKPLVQVAPQPPAPLKMDGLPDPTYDAEGYATEVAKRIDARNNDIARYQGEVARTQNAGQQKAQALWNDFSIEYDEYAQDREKAEFAASKVLKKAVDRGLDIDRYMYGHANKFYEDVVSEYDQIFGKPGADAEDADYGPTTRSVRAAPVQRRDRTAGVYGGQDGGPRRKKADEVERHDMFDDIREFQRANGFY